MSDYQSIDLKALQGNFKTMTEPIFVPNPEELDLDQIPTLQKMLDKLHFSYIEMEGELDVLKSQIIATNCAISALQKVKSVRDAIKGESNEL
jgi:hypothetical protein